MAIEPECHSGKEELIKLAALRPPHDRARATSLLLSFLRDPSDTKARSNLVVLRMSEAHRIRAQLHVTPTLPDLPLIRRTGTSTPWMRGYPLGFDVDRVTDPRLQRAKSYFLTKQAAVLEWIDLLMHVFKSLRPWEHFPTDVIGEVFGPSRVGWHYHLHALLEQWHGRALDEALKSGLQLIEHKTVGQLPASLANYFVSRARLEEATAGSPEELVHFLTALKFALADDGAFTYRHLGEERLKALLRFQGAVRNLVIQGAGDLSMNEWNVAYYHAPDGRAATVLPEHEPYTSRLYNCLIVWKREADGREIETVVRYINAAGPNQKRLGVTIGHDLAIAPLRFSRGEPCIRIPGRAAPIDELVDLALYGKLVVRDGQVLDLAEVVDQFQDLRHVYLLPNLNPPDKVLQDIVDDTLKKLQTWRGTSGTHLPPWVVAELDLASEEGLFTLAERCVRAGEFPHAPGPLRDARAALLQALSDTIQLFLVSNYQELHRLLKRPRHIFSELHYGTDVWLLEYALLSEASLRHLATTSAIAVDSWRLGAPRVWTEFCLLLNGYSRRGRLADVREPGDFAWDEQGDAPRLTIRLKPSAYPCTLVGIGSIDDPTVNDSLYLLAWGHSFDRGLSIFGCAELLAVMGARYVLVVDEGQDVFQCFFRDELLGHLERYRNAEEGADSVDEWMPVPLAVSSGMLQRRALRASLAFWQVRRSEMPPRRGAPS